MSVSQGGAGRIEMKTYTIEIWSAGRWQLLIGAPQTFASRAEAQAELRFQAATALPPRLRLVDRTGAVIYSV